jgi:hypothetical protein
MDQWGRRHGHHAKCAVLGAGRSDGHGGHRRVVALVAGTLQGVPPDQQDITFLSAYLSEAGLLRMTMAPPP